MIETIVDPGPAAAAFYRDLKQTMGAIAENATKGLNDPQTGTLWYSLGGGTTALAITDYIEGPIAFPFLITGWVLLSRTAGAIVLSVSRATYVEYPSFTAIHGTEPPTLVSTKNRDDAVASWTTRMEADDILAIGVTSNAGALTRVSLGLRYRKQGSKPA